MSLFSHLQGLHLQYVSPSIAFAGRLIHVSESIGEIGWNINGRRAISLFYLLYLFEKSLRVFACATQPPTPKEHNSMKVAPFSCL